MFRNTGGFGDTNVTQCGHQYFYSFANDPILFDDIKKLREINQLHIDSYRNIDFGHTRGRAVPQMIEIKYLNDRFKFFR